MGIYHQKCPKCRKKITEEQTITDWFICDLCKGKIIPKIKTGEDEKEKKKKDVYCCKFCNKKFCIECMDDFWLAEKNIIIEKVKRLQE